MPNLMAEFLKDTETTVPNNDELTDINKLANDQLDWERRVVELEAELEHAKEALKQIQEFLLPEAMSSVGMSEFKLSNGMKITVRDDVYASIRKDYMEAAVTWLDENGLGGIVKDTVVADFGRGEYDAVKALILFCKEKGLNAQEKLSVHPQTLKATIKEQLANGVEFPEEYFSIAPVRKSIIKLK